MKTIPLPRPPLYRFFEILPATLEWMTLIGLAILGVLVPVVAAMIVIMVDVYWLIKVTYLSVYLIIGYRRMRRSLKVDWLAKVKSVKEAKGLAGANYDNLYHLVLFVIKDEYQVVESSIEAVANSHYDRSKVIVVVSAEEKFYDQTKEVLERARDKYKSVFKDFIITVHPFGIKGEMVGKGANETWGGRQAQKLIDKWGIPYENVIVEVFDIDTQIHPDYLARVSYAFLRSPKPLRVSYQPIPLFTNNAWEAPAIARVISCSTSFWQMMEQSRPERMATFSSHSMSFKTVVDIGFWCTDAVSEDSRIFWQCLLHYNGDYEIDPLFFPVAMDMVVAETFWQTMISQYKQQRRWAWGVENLPYVFYNFIKKRGVISWRKKARYAFRLFEGTYTWATTALIIAIVGWIPIFLGGDTFTNTVFAQTLPVVTRTLSTFAMIGLFAATIISNVMIKRDPRRVSFARRVVMVLQWFLLPITTILFGSIVALDAHTRLLLGKYMGFYCTPKIRKEKNTSGFSAIGERENSTSSIN